MDEVAELAQLGKGTLYLYFHTKEDLLLGVAMRHQQRLIDKFQAQTELSSDGLDLVKRLLATYAEHMSTPPEHLKMVMARWVQATPFTEGQTNAATMRENAVRIFGLMRAAVERGQSDGTIRAGLDAPRLCLQLWSGINGALLLTLQMCCMGQPNPLSESAPSIAEMIDLLSDAIGVPPRLRDTSSVPDAGHPHPGSHAGHPHPGSDAGHPHPGPMSPHEQMSPREALSPHDARVAAEGVRDA